METKIDRDHSYTPSMHHTTSTRSSVQSEKSLKESDMTRSKDEASSSK